MTRLKPGPDRALAPFVREGGFFYAPTMSHRSPAGNHDFLSPNADLPLTGC